MGGTESQVGQMLRLTIGLSFSYPFDCLLLLFFNMRQPCFCRILKAFLLWSRIVIHTSPSRHHQACVNEVDLQ